MTPRFTVCLLFYGDYPDLARRCSGSLDGVFAGGNAMCRIGTNIASSTTMDILSEAMLRWWPIDYTIFSEINYLKYPVMWQLFYEKPITTEFVMWFDDDSYLREPANHGWLGSVEEAMKDADMLGAIYTQHLGGQQHLWVPKQPWYTDKPTPAGHRVRFATGGWWCIRTEVLQKWQWPTLELQHRGGDVMLGELCRQQGLRLKHFNTGVAINADENGKESKAKTRRAKENPVGWRVMP